MLLHSNQKGVTSKRLFLKWLIHFAEIVVPNVSQKILVLFNDHSTHTKNSEALQLARESGVIMVSLPGHNTHRLQPLDVGFLRHLSSHYIDEVEKWLQASPGRCVIQANVAVLWVMRAKSSYCGQNNRFLPFYGIVDSKQIFISRPPSFSFFWEYSCKYI